MDSTFLSTGTEDSNVITREDEIVETMIKQALVAVKRGNYSDAIAQLNKVLDHGTGNFRILGDIYMWYERVCRELKNHTLALEFLERELAIKQLQGDRTAVCDVFRRTTELELEMGNYQKAKRTAESFVEFATSKCEQFAEQARALLISVCLESIEEKSNSEDRLKLLAEAGDEITAAKNTGKLSLSIRMLEAKYKALRDDMEQKLEAQGLYEKCIEISVAANDYQKVSRAYFEKALYAGNRRSDPMKEDLRRAIFYAETYGEARDAAFYKIILSKILLHCNSAHEAFLHCKSALSTARKQEESSMMKSSLLLLAACLNALGKRAQAAYFVVLGSVLTVEDNMLPFYEMIDEMMVLQRAETEENAEVELAVDASEDPSPNEMALKFVVKLEHTMSAETWRSVIRGLIEAAKEKNKKKMIKKDEEPVDFLEQLCKMSERLEGQRCELPPSTYHRPPSAASSTGTTKSHKFPGLKKNLMRFKDKHIMSRLNRSKNSSASMPHESGSLRNDTTTSSSISK